MFNLTSLALTLLLLGCALSAPAPFFMDDIADLVSSASHSSDGSSSTTSAAAVPGTSIEFDSCAADGTVSSVVISPCEGGNGTDANPCTFTHGKNYTITLTYTPDQGSSSPRTGLAAHDATNAYGADHYAYSGQSFDGCEYTSCPVVASAESTYTYEFVTLNSVFDGLTFNMTTELFGPSIMCASFPVKFVS